MSTLSPSFRNGNPKSSVYRGVSWDRQHNCWHASIRVNGIKEFLGLWDDEELAAQAYDERAREVGRKRLNFPSDSENSATAPVSASSDVENTTRYFGVEWSKQKKLWRVAFRDDRGICFQAYFADEYTAAQAYDYEAFARYGNSDRFPLNFNRPYSRHELIAGRSLIRAGRHVFTTVKDRHAFQDWLLG